MAKTTPVCVCLRVRILTVITLGYWPFLDKQTAINNFFQVIFVKYLSGIDVFFQGEYDIIFF